MRTSSAHGPPVCADGLFGEELLQRGYRPCASSVLAYLEAHPGAGTRHASRAVDAPERVAARILGRLTDDGLPDLTTDGTPGSPVMSAGLG